MVDNSIFAYNFRRIRKGKGWSKAYTASRGAVTENYIGGIESGHKSFGQKAQKKWADIFEIDYREFHKPKTTAKYDPHENEWRDFYREIINNGADYEQIVKVLRALIPTRQKVPLPKRKRSSAA